MLKISKQIQKLETTYSLMPKLRKIETKVKAEFAEVKGTAVMDILLRGPHPSSTVAADSVQLHFCW